MTGAMANVTRFCVIGGSGFIGRNLVTSLMMHPARRAIRAVVNKFPTDLFNNLPSVEVRTARLEDASSLAQAIEGSDVVYHLASGTIPSTSNADMRRDIEVNLSGSLNLLDACLQAGVQRIVYISSGGTVYGRLNQVPVPESHPTFPICSYGIVKLAVERYLHLYNALYSLDYTVLRLSNPYGQFQSSNGLQGAVPVFISKLLRREPIEIWGDGSVVRDFLHVDDVVRALHLAAQMPKGECGIYNVGSGRGTSLNELLEMLARVSDLPIATVYSPGRNYDVPRSVLDVSKIRADLGWQPQLNLEEGLRKTFDWFARQENQGSRYGN